MKLKTISVKVFSIFLSVMLLIALLLLFTNLKLKNEVAKLTSDYEKLEQNFKLLKQNYELLKNENEKLKSENKLITQKSVSLAAEVDKTIDRLTEFENTVKDSITWFKQNNNIKNFENYEFIKDELSICLKPKDECKIDLTCIYNINKKNNFRYIEDDTATGKEDFLKDLDLIYKQKGGDCEEISFLFQAEYNYLRDQCLLNFSREQIIPIIGEKELDRNYMYIICGVFDPGGIVKNWAGHCLVALGKNPVNTTSDIYLNVKNSILVEPQTGEYIANMTNTTLIKIFDNEMPPNTLYYVSMIITENDLKVFYPYGDKVEWIGYADFMQNSNTIRERVKK